MIKKALLVLAGPILAADIIFMGALTKKIYYLPGVVIALLCAFIIHRFGFSRSDLSTELTKKE